MAFLKNITISGTGYLSIPVGTTAERLTPTTSTLVSFTTVGVVAGGWTAPAGVTSVEVLVVGGGAGGGHSIYGGPGGGAGGVCYASNFAVTPGANYAVTVGGGGANSTNGSDSNFGLIVAKGGGTNSANGASGGGGGHSNPPNQGGSATQPSNTIAGVVGYGNRGGAHEYVTPYPCGGGGGAGGAGGTGNAYLGRPGDGGIGVPFNITGSQVYYGGGGGATQYNGNSYGMGIGGLGGGGSGVYSGTGIAGAANTGGGGGGGGGNGVAGSGGAGGSGVVYIRYRTSEVTPSVTLGSLRVNKDNNINGLEFYSASNAWRSMSIPFLTRTIITTSYMVGGYKDAVAWNNANKTSHASDTTYNLGDNSIERSFNYQSGACGKNIGFIFGAGNGHAVASNYVIAYNMRTESQYSGTFSRTLNYNRNNAATIFQEHYIAWNTGGGGTNIDEYNMVTETKIQDIGGFSSTGMWGMSHENYGVFYWEEDSRHFTFATRQAMVRYGTQVGAHSQQKSTQSKQFNCYAGHEGSYNGGNNFRRTNMYTNTSGGTVAKPSTNSGEENYCLGQDWNYTIGLYNGSGQVNVSFRFNYATEAGYTGGTSMEPKGHAGASSAHSFWRDN